MHINVYRYQTTRISLLACLLLWCCLTGLHASQVTTLPDSPHFSPADTTDVRWVFSGVVTSEQGDQYGYFFQMDRLGHKFHSQAALFDVQTKAVLLQDESEAELTDVPLNHWHVGHAFLQFNPINDSWVFGFKQANKEGFNFKVDMLKPSESVPSGQGLRAGVDVLISQAHALNGHIKAASMQDEHFVTAKHAWFRQMSVTEKQTGEHAVKGVLCRFEDGSGFYSINLPEADAIRGAMTGRFDAEGVATPMSQFVDVKALKEGRWSIRVPSPDQDVLLSSFFEKSSMVAGVTESDEARGFCLLSEDAIHKAVDEPVDVA